MFSVKHFESTFAFRVAAATVTLMLTAAGCSSGSDAPATSVPSATVRETTPPTVAPTPTQEPLLNRPVLGGPRDAWTRAKGPPSKGVVGDQFKGDGDLAFVEAAFTEVTAGNRAWYVEFQAQRSKDFSVDVARKRAMEYFPADAKPVRTYKTSSDQTVEVYRSADLAAVMKDAKSFGGEKEEPGTFILIAQRGGAARTSRVVISLGNNP